MDKNTPTIAMAGAGLCAADLERAVRFFHDGLGMIEVARFQTAEKGEVIMGFGPGSTSPLESGRHPLAISYLGSIPCSHSPGSAAAFCSKTPPSFRAPPKKHLVTVG